MSATATEVTQSNPTNEPEEGWELLELVGGRWPTEHMGTAQRTQMAIRAAAASLALASVYGVAVGSLEASLALKNAIALPGVMALSTLTALPAGLLAFKLTGGKKGTSHIIIASAAGNFAASLVLASLSPLVALYYHTSDYWGAPLAMATTTFAVVVGFVSSARLLFRSRQTMKNKRSFAFTTSVLFVVQLLALLQFIHLASPILPETTLFDAGIDAVLQ